MFIIVAFGNFFQIFKKILLKFAEVAPVGAWIEIDGAGRIYTGRSLKSPLLGRGLKLGKTIQDNAKAAKSPLLGRGLKLLWKRPSHRLEAEVAPVGAWIEIRT